MAKTSDEMVESMKRNLEKASGKNLDAWVAVARATGLGKHREIMKVLKGEHGLTHGYANLVALETLQSAASHAASSDELVEQQYSSAKAALRPIYDKLVVAISRFGSDVELAPKKAYVSLRRNKQFGLIQPSTPTRLDVGINLKGVAPSGRLEASGSFNAMVSHRVRLESAAQVDAELIGWLKQAYDAS